MLEAAGERERELALLSACRIQYEYAQGAGIHLQCIDRKAAPRIFTDNICEILYNCTKIRRIGGRQLCIHC